MPNYSRFGEHDPWGGLAPAGQVHINPTIGHTTGAVRDLMTGGRSTTGGAPPCPTLPTNPRAGQPGVRDQYFGTLADHDAWVAANPGCVIPPFIQDSVLNAINFTVNAPANGQLPTDLTVKLASYSGPATPPATGLPIAPSTPGTSAATYSLPNLPDGTYTIVAAGTGVDTASQQVPVAGGQTVPASVTLQATASSSSVPGYPTNYPAGPVFGDQTAPCAQQFFQYLQANPQFNPATLPLNKAAGVAFNNPAAQAIAARTGMSCRAWLGMQETAKRQWVAIQRHGNPAFQNDAGVIHLVRQMDRSCLVRPAGQPSMPQPAWTVDAYAGFATQTPSCAVWAQDAAKQYGQYVASVAPPLPPPGPTPPPVAPASTGPSTGKILLFVAIAGAAIWGLSKYANEPEPEEKKQLPEPEKSEEGVA